MALGMTRKEQWALIGTIGVIVAAIGVQGWRGPSRGDLVYVQGQGYWRRLATIDAKQADKAPAPTPSPTPGWAASRGSTPGPAKMSLGARAAPPADATLDLNAATAAQLERLPGIGPSKAAAILATRQRLGRFGSVDQLNEVKGIGPATLGKLRPFVRVGASLGSGARVSPRPLASPAPGTPPSSIAPGAKTPGAGLKPPSAN
jgi:competence ComEA-like helix-hairpin-helix protein